jgi:hypothetical protein
MMEKKHVEIGMSSGLVISMIALLLVVQMTAPLGVRSAGFVIVMLLFMMAMGLAGVKLLDM